MAFARAHVWIYSAVMTAAPPLTRQKVLTLALPIMAANIATPLVGLVDIAVIGRSGSTADIAAVALGALIFNFLFWAFGFLRMGMTGLTAQADGRGDDAEVRASLLRGIMTGLAIGLVMLLAQWPLQELAFGLFSAETGVETAGRAYFDARIWSAPATLAGFALYGWLIGLGRTGMALALQAALNVLNAGLSILFVAGLGWGVPGVAWASTLALWLHLLPGVAIVWWILRTRTAISVPSALIFAPAALRRLLGVNRDIFLRTLALLAGFAWFNEMSLREGTSVMAGNAVLLQFIAIIAYFLDAFAHVTETVTGKAAGRGDWQGLKRALRLTTEQAAGFAAMASLALLAGGGTLISLITTDPATRGAAAAFLPYCALVPVLGFASWQLDGLMIGTTRGPLMRNAMIASFLIYVALDFALRPAFGGVGLWLAFLGYYIARAGTLSFGLKGLKRDVTAQASAPTAPANDV